MDDFEKTRKKDEEVTLDKEFAQKLKKDLQKKEEELMKNKNYQEDGKKENNFTYFIVVGIVVLLCSLILGIYFINKSRNINSTYEVEEINV